jgi:hypothetical protein
LADDGAFGLGPKHAVVRWERGLTSKSKGSGTCGRAITRHSEPLRLDPKIAPKE